MICEIFDLVSEQMSFAHKRDFAASALCFCQAMVAQILRLLKFFHEIRPDSFSQLHFVLMTPSHNQCTQFPSIFQILKMNEKFITTD